MAARKESEVTGEKILIIEDTPMNMELATDLLEAAGYVVFGASNAEEGIKLARAEQPALVLMDVALPGMDGLSATKLLKADPATCRIPIVALTAHAMKGDAAKALDAGCHGYITKPIDTRAFPIAIAEYIQPVLELAEAS